MNLVELTSGTGEGKFYVNTDQVSFLRTGKYSSGTEIHFDKGNAMLAAGSCDEVAKILMGEKVKEEKPKATARKSSKKDGDGLADVVNPEEDNGLKAASASVSAVKEEENGKDASSK